MHGSSPYAIALAGPDRSGLFLELCAVLSRLNCNLGSNRMSRLAGSFAGVMVAFAPPDLGRAELEAALAPIAREGMHVSVRPLAVDEPLTRHAPGAHEVFISASGGDRPGVVAALSDAVTGVGAEFTDITATVRDGEFVLVVEVDVPGAVGLAAFQAAVDSAGDAIGIRFLCTPADPGELGI